MPILQTERTQWGTGGRMKIKTCYWNRTKECDIDNCRGEKCIFYYPTIKGLIQEPNWREYKEKVVVDQMADLLTTTLPPTYEEFLKQLEKDEYNEE